jgi:hypothetical protein
MRFLANENFPGAAVEALRLAGHDVVWVRTEAAGSCSFRLRITSVKPYAGSSARGMIGPAGSPSSSQVAYACATFRVSRLEALYREHASRTE